MAPGRLIPGPYPGEVIFRVPTNSVRMPTGILMVRGVSHFLRIAQKGRRDPLAQQKNNAHPIARSKQDERRELILSARHSLLICILTPNSFTHSIATS